MWWSIKDSAPVHTLGDVALEWQEKLAIESQPLEATIQCLNPNQPTGPPPRHVTREAGLTTTQLLWSHALWSLKLLTVSACIRAVNDFLLTLKMYSREKEKERDAKWKVLCSGGYLCLDIAAPACPVWRPLCCKAMFMFRRSWTPRHAEREPERERIREHVHTIFLSFVQ